MIHVKLSNNCCLLWTFLLLLVLLVISGRADSAAAAVKEYTCGGCYCIPGNNATCPSELRPNNTYSVESLKVLRSLRWTNPLSLSCNPYTNTTCNTNEYPLTTVQPGIDYCCVIDFDTTPFCNSYRTRTFRGTVQAARSRGLYVTHTGPCGLCSNLHDLSIYIEKALTLRKLSTICAFAGLRGIKSGIKCLNKLINFTLGCSKIWAYNPLNTQQQCPECFISAITREPVQAPAPSCTLNDCLQCDEDKSGPVFKKFAGRNRRNSGIVTDIIRDCSDFQSELRHNISCTRTG
jgi:hypothetical protein